ncbi:hypothetical protein, partial [Mycoplasmopsis bovis]|uniref:hypothetical protein n=1 Tax=Mycoplasmopsis bovis TaxID=28903 RepID=UPI003D2B7368
ENDAQELLSGLQIPKEKWNSPMSQLTANQKIKVLLAKALFSAVQPPRAPNFSYNSPACV